MQSFPIGLADGKGSEDVLVGSNPWLKSPTLLSLSSPTGLADGEVKCQCSGGSKVAQGMAGALSARPLSYDNPRALQCFNSKGLSTCFVSMSAGFSAPGTLESLKSPFLMRSCTHRSAVAKCRTFPSPLLRQIPIAAVASVRTDKFKLMPKSLAMV